MTRVCLTGATGHVGYAILKELQNHEDKDVKILIRKDSDIFDGLRCEKEKGDVTDYDSLIHAFQGVDIVYHVAGCVEIKPGNEEHVYDVNVNGTKNVLRACRKCGVKRMVYMGSVDTYIPLPENQVMRETWYYDPDELEGTYAKTKAEATAWVLSYNGKGGLETVVCQPSACMGPYDYKVSAIGSMIRMFMGGSFPITMTFGGYNFVDVRDVAKGTVAAGDVPGAAGQVYILCNKTCTVDEFIRLLARVCGNKPPRIKLGKGIIDFAAPIMESYYKATKQPAIFTRYAVRKLCSNCNFSYEKAAAELGYAPRPLEESLKDTVEWIKEHEEAEKAKTEAKAMAHAAAQAEAEAKAAAAAVAALRNDESIEEAPDEAPQSEQDETIARTEETETAEKTPGIFSRLRFGRRAKKEETADAPTDGETQDAEEPAKAEQ